MGGTQTRYVYVTRGLRIDSLSISDLSHPCVAETRSRWIKVNDCTSSRVIGSSTKAAFQQLLSSSTDATNSKIKDIFFPSTGLSCDSSDVDGKNPDTFFFKIIVNGQCFENTHPDNYQVYDYTPWVSKHPGGADNIRAFADVQGTFVLTFPGVQHSMTRWVTGKKFLLSLGREGDITSLKKLPPALLREDIAEAFGSSVDTIAATGKVMVCGSPYEVATVHDENSAPLYKGKMISLIQTKTFSNAMLT